MTLELVTAFLTGPIFIGAIAAVWYYFTKVREPARIKEQTISSAAVRERDRSYQVFDEAQRGRAQDRQNDREDKYVGFLLASNDGKVSEILDEIKTGKVATATLIIHGNTEAAEQGRLIIASQNQVISLLSRFFEELPALKGIEDYGLDMEIKRASIESAAVQQVKAVVAAAIVASEPANIEDSPGHAKAHQIAEDAQRDAE